MTETQDSVVVASELVSKPQRIAAPKYRWMKTYPTIGAGTFNINPASRTTVQFEVPTRCINYSRSYLCGTLNIPAPGNGVFNWRHADAVSFISSLNFRTRSGAVMIEMEHLQNYTQIINKYETSIEDVMSADELDVISPYRGYVATSAEAKRPDNTAVVHPNVEFKYCAVGADNTATPYHFRIPLSRVVPNSVFSRRSDLKLPEIAIMTIGFGPGTKAVWRGTDATNPTTAAAAMANVMTCAASLELAVQEDLTYEAMLDARMNAGYSIPINFPMHTQTMMPASTSQSIAVTYNSGHGKRIVKIYHAPFAAAETSNLAYDHDCVAVQKVENYHIKLKGSRTSDDDFKTDPNDPTAYLHHKPLIEGTAITNAKIYHYNFAHVEDLARIGGPKQWKELSFRKDDAEVGISLDQDYKFEFVAATQNAAYTHYTFAVLQRQLTITSVTAMVE